MAEANEDLCRFVSTVREMRDKGFSVDVIVEIALADGKLPMNPEANLRNDADRAIVRSVYLDNLTPELRP